jgi:hypothetical protein
VKVLSHRRKRIQSGGRLIALLLPLAAMAVVARGAGTAADSGVASIDLRPAFTNWALPLRSQGARGTCSVFAMTGAIEYALAHQCDHGKVLSVEFLNWASNRATTNSSDGGFFSDLWAGYVAFGVCPETDLPYHSNYEPGLSPGVGALEHARQMAGTGLRLHWIKPWDVRTGLADDQFRELKRVLGQRWPVCGGFRWPKNEQWKDGVLRMAGPEGVFDGHSVLLVGFRDDPAQPGGGVFLIRNSGGGVQDGAMTFEFVRAYMNDGAWIDHDVVEPIASPNNPGKSPL